MLNLTLLLYDAPAVATWIVADPKKAIDSLQVGKNVALKLGDRLG